MILHSHVPLVLDEPTGDELVVTRMQPILSKPSLVLEFKLKFRVSQNLSSIYSRSSTDAGHAAIDKGSGRGFNHSHRQAKVGNHLRVWFGWRVEQRQ